MLVEGQLLLVYHRHHTVLITAVPLRESPETIVEDGQRTTLTQIDGRNNYCLHDYDFRVTLNRVSHCCMIVSSL